MSDTEKLVGEGLRVYRRRYYSLSSLYSHTNSTHCTLYTFTHHCTLHTLTSIHAHCTLYTVHCTLHTKYVPLLPTCQMVHPGLVLLPGPVPVSSVEHLGACSQQVTLTVACCSLLVLVPNCAFFFLKKSPIIAPPPFPT